MPAPHSAEDQTNARSGLGPLDVAANWLCVIAGILPLVVVCGYEDLVRGPLDNDVYTWQIFLGPLLIAAASAPWLGVRRAARIVLIGVPLAGIAFLLLGLALMFVIPS